MFFQEAITIEESIQKIQQELFTDIEIQMGLLHLRLCHNEAPESDQSETLHQVQSLKQEFEHMKRLFEKLLIPAVKKCLSDETCLRPFSSFKVLRASHDKQRIILNDLKEQCDLFVLHENWSDDKKGRCLTSFKLYNAYLSYLNFAESTLIPLLKKLHQNAVERIENEQGN